MDCFKEIWGRSLPNFGYVIYMDDRSCCVVVLGGHSPRCRGDVTSKQSIADTNRRMQDIYNKEILTDDDKKKLANLKQRMQSLCDTREEGLYSGNEQKAFIEKLSATEKVQLEKQIQMYKDCREYYSQYYG